MKILLLVTGLGMGGAEHVVVNLADTLVKHGHYIKIAYLTGEALVVPQHDNIEVIPINITLGINLPNRLLKLRKLILDFKPDVVHSHMFHANVLSRLIRLITPIPRLICTAHSNNEGGKGRMLIYRLTDRLADISTNVSEDAVREFIAKGAVKPGRMVAIPNGVDIVIFKYSLIAREKIRENFNIKDKKIILAVGRFNIAKDYPNLLKAVSLLKIKRQDFIILIAGDGPLKFELQQLVIEFEINNYVKFLGIRRDIPDLMSAADIFVLSSAWEGFGLVVAEAMACERMVVATNCGGIKEVVGECGIIVETKNSAMLADRLDIALNMRINERNVLGLEARKRIIDNYSLESNVNAYLKLYS